MNSRLYDCRVVHDRKKPRRHRFGYRIFMFYLDLDELEQLDKRIPILGYNRSNFYSLRDSDHFNEGAATLRNNVDNFLEKQGLREQRGKVYLLTHLRTFGHVFNPVSFFFVEDKQGAPLCLIAEVANTFKEQKLFLVSADHCHRGVYRDRQIKQFYISPFSDLDTHIHFNLHIPGERLAVGIHESQNGEGYFHSTLIGEARPLTTAQLLKYTLRFPFITVGIVLGIHWQALRIFLKKIPVRRKSAHPEHQTDIRPYLRHHQS